MSLHLTKSTVNDFLPDYVLGLCRLWEELGLELHPSAFYPLLKRYGLNHKQVDRAFEKNVTELSLAPSHIRKTRENGWKPIQIYKITDIGRVQLKKGSLQLSERLKTIGINAENFVKPFYDTLLELKKEFGIA